ncbi:MAG: NADH-quinone oxidoreductase subunit M [Gemmatimonadetes bacterium]|nr:NADH-quinone oxidoreductase subunit M [Gemmatimonadota bacterium]MYC91555.1 NADH-quinone oxidoreductase subunit M [Gemmatimonadota bacterium]
MTDFIASIPALYEDWVLHALLWLPVAGLFHVMAAAEDRAKHIAFSWSGTVFVLSLGLWWSFDPGGGGFAMQSSTPWIESWGVSYALGLDGISVFMVMLTTLTTPIAILGSFEYIKTRRKAFYALMLLLQTGVVGVFLATDIFLFYVFFELTLIPMYFIVGIWGGERRIYAAVKFFLYTAVGSLLMLVAILYIYFSSGSGSFSYEAFLGADLTMREQLWLFAAFALAFGIKVPIFPLHTWLPDAHVEAPTPGSVILASLLLKMGTYGFLRFLLPFFPGAAQHPTVVAVMLVLGVAGIIYAAWVAAVQPDAKKLVAYTSVAHMGFVVIGVFALTVNGLQGGLVVMISHGISTGALFLLLGMMYERRHTRRIEDFGGIGRVAPFFATAFVITALASIGLPGTSGFIGEFLALIGTFETHAVTAIIAATGVIFAAYYMLPMVQRVLFNKLDKPENRTFADLSRRECVVLGPLVALMIWIGVHPAPFLRRMEPSVQVVLERVEEARTVLFDGASDPGAGLAPRPAGEEE